MDKVVKNLFIKTQDIFKKCPDEIIDDGIVGELLYYAAEEVKQLGTFVNKLYMHTSDIDQIHSLSDTLDSLYYVDYNDIESVRAALTWITDAAEMYSSLIATCLSKYINYMKAQ